MDNTRFKGRDSIFATRLRKCMGDSKTIQEKLAKVTGITRQAIAQYCDGSVMPNIEKLYLFAEYFKVSTDYLLGLTDIKERDVTNDIMQKEILRLRTTLRNINVMLDTIKLSIGTELI